MSKEAMKLALDALEWCHGGEPCGTAEAITALREALAEQPAQQEQKPVTDKENEKFSRDVSNFAGADPEATKYALEEFLKNRTSPPAQRTWVGLTDEEMSEIIDAEIGFNSCWGPEEAFARAIEAKLKEKNA